MAPAVTTTQARHRIRRYPRGAVADQGDFGAERVDVAAERYEQAERAYLDKIRDRAPASVLEAAASEVAAGAELWNQRAMRRYLNLKASGTTGNDERQADIAAEQAELLSELWRDITAAHREP